MSRVALPDLVRQLEVAGIVQRHPDLAEQLLRRGAVIPLIHQPSGIEIDLVILGSGLERLALTNASAAEIDGVTVPVAASTHLAVMKALAGRGKDLEDLRSLLASGTVDLREARNLLRQLEAALDQSDLTPILEQAIADVGPVSEE